MQPFSQPFKPKEHVVRILHEDGQKMVTEEEDT